MEERGGIEEIEKVEEIGKMEAIDEVEEIGGVEEEKVEWPAACQPTPLHPTPHTHPHKMVAPHRAPPSRASISGGGKAESQRRRR